MKRHILGALLCVALGFTACTEGPRPLRMCAEWEPALGTMIVWPLKIPSELVRLLAEDEIIFVLVAYDEDGEKPNGTGFHWSRPATPVYLQPKYLPRRRTPGSNTISPP